MFSYKYFMNKNPMKRLQGTNSLTAIYKQDTPGESTKLLKKLAVESNLFKMRVRKFDYDKGKIKNKVICHPNKSDTACILPPNETKRRVHEDVKTFAYQSQRHYDNVSIGDSSMADHKQGGGKKRVGLECDSSTHIINQLRAVRDLRDPDGSPVTFNDGIQCLVNQKYAIQALKLYEKFEKPSQKEALIEKLAHSPKSFLNTIRSSDEYLLENLEEFIRSQNKKPKITVAERVSGALSKRRLTKLVLEDLGSIWRSSLIHNDGQITHKDHAKNEGLFGLNKLRKHLYENIASFYQIPFEDKTQ